MTVQSAVETTIRVGYLPAVVVYGAEIDGCAVGVEEEEHNNVMI